MQQRLPLNTQIEALFLYADILDYPDYQEDTLERFGLLAEQNIKGLAISEVQSEYIRIFSIHATALGSVPYASWWIDGKMSGNSLKLINEFYKRCGYEFDLKNIKHPADHIAYMIRFVAILAEEEKFKEIGEFAIFLDWLEDFAKSLEKAADINIFTVAVYNSLNIINSLKEEVCSQV